MFRLANVMQPGTIKRVQQSQMAFKCMENINSFLDAARAFGVPSQELFQTVDLWEKQNLNAVIICLQALGRKVKRERERTHSQLDSLISACLRFIYLLVHDRLPSMVNALSDPRRRIKMREISLRSNCEQATQLLDCRQDPTRVPIRAVSILATLVICSLVFYATFRCKKLSRII